MEGGADPFGFSILAFDCLDSTNEEAKRRCADGAADGFVILAAEQAAGRGRRGRRWHSPPGNLYFSLIARPCSQASEAAQLGFAACLAAAAAIERHLPAGCVVACKWPNDVLVNGRKIAGMLLESAAMPDGGLDWVIIGLGINVARHPDEADLLYPATSVSGEGGEGATPRSVLTDFLPKFDCWRKIWEREGFRPLRRAWLDRAHGRGAPITVRLENETLEGIFEDLDDEGALVLRTATGIRKVMAGDVFYPARD